MSSKINVFFDTEFNFLTDELISIGCVSDTGQTFYRVSNEWKLENCNEFVLNNVVPLLPPKEEWCSNEKLIKDLGLWALKLGKKVRWWAWYGAYDLVVLHKLCGRGIDKLPFWMPKYIHDFRAEIEYDGHYTFSPKKFNVEKGKEHDALNDAKSLMEAYKARKQTIDCIIEDSIVKTINY